MRSRGEKNSKGKAHNPKSTFLTRKENRPDISAWPVSFLAPRVGFEPTTTRLTAAGSAVELPRNMVGVTRFELVTSSV